MSLPSFGLQTSNAKRTEWFLRRAYVRAEAYVACFVREAYLLPGALFSNKLISEPPFDPWLFFASSSATLPASLTHFIYHTYPTDSGRLAEAAMKDLGAGRIERAEQLFAVGAAPSAAPREAINRACEAELHIPGLPSRYPSERLLNWKPKAVKRAVCSCGFDAAAAAPDDSLGRILAAASGVYGDNGGDGMPLSAQAQELVHRKKEDPTLDLVEQWMKLYAPDAVRKWAAWADTGKRKTSESYDTLVTDQIVFGACQFVQYWMLPFNGTVGRYRYPLADALEKDQAAWGGGCQHSCALVRQFFVAYVLDLRRRLL